MIKMWLLFFARRAEKPIAHSSEVESAVSSDFKDSKTCCECAKAKVGFKLSMSVETFTKNTCASTVQLLSLTPPTPFPFCVCVIL